MWGGGGNAHYRHSSLKRMIGGEEGRGLQEGKRLCRRETWMDGEEGASHSRCTSLLLLWDHLLQPGALKPAQKHTWRICHNTLNGRAFREFLCIHLLTALFTTTSFFNIFCLAFCSLNAGKLRLQHCFPIMFERTNKI